MMKRLSKIRLFYVHFCRSLQSFKVFAEMASVIVGGFISAKYRSESFFCSIFSIPTSKRKESIDSFRSFFGGTALHYPQSYRAP